ncbi:hypothetical protein ADK75_08305 [Streptomyces virginiae]|uniref:Lysine transporter LysE n=1 Tax=Streptomyces virginiae TaxID=1961 RepID=A0A0L8N0P4_STRVG|nr:LysE family transporter [Streptomyces virginiae]KOG56148.1 hypothetical protein ADK75_08305 [Streptomyces virginiae]
MSELMTPALAGAAAGLGVAMPMGAMSVLLLQEAMRGRRAAVAAAAGIAAVDLGYAALATALGPWVASHISPVEAWVRLASAAILLTIAAHGLAGARPPDAVPDAGALPAHPSPPTVPQGASATSASPAVPAPPVGSAPSASSPASGASATPSPSHCPATSAPAAAPSPAPHPAAPGTSAAPGSPTVPAAVARPGRVFARYVGLTALNPTTALYFAALTTAQGAALRTGAAGGAFLLGVGAASLIWQQSLVALGAFAGTRIPDRARVWTFRLGYGLVAAYAVKIALPLP